MNYTWQSRYGSLSGKNYRTLDPSVSHYDLYVRRYGTTNSSSTTIFDTTSTNASNTNTDLDLDLDTDTTVSANSEGEQTTFELPANHTIEGGAIRNGAKILNADGRVVGKVVIREVDSEGDGNTESYISYTIFSTEGLPAGWTNPGDGTFVDENNKAVIPTNIGSYQADYENLTIKDAEGNVVGRLIRTVAETGQAKYDAYLYSNAQTQEPEATAPEAAQPAAPEVTVPTNRTANITDSRAQEIAQSLRTAINNRDLASIRAFLNSDRLTAADKVAVFQQMGGRTFLEELEKQYDLDGGNGEKETMAEVSRSFIQICVEAAEDENPYAADLIAQNLLTLDHADYVFGGSNVFHTKRYNQAAINALFEFASGDVLIAVNNSIANGKANYDGHTYSNLDNLLDKYKENGDVSQENKNKVDGYHRQYMESLF